VNKLQADCVLLQTLHCISAKLMKPNEHINRQNKLVTIIVHETYNYKCWRNILKHMTCCTFKINNTLWVLSSYVKFVELRW